MSNRVELRGKMAVAQAAATRFLVELVSPPEPRIAAIAQVLAGWVREIEVVRGLALGCGISDQATVKITFWPCHNPKKKLVVLVQLTGDESGYFPGWFPKTIWTEDQKVAAQVVGETFQLTITDGPYPWVSGLRTILSDQGAIGVRDLPCSDREILRLDWVR